MKVFYKDLEGQLWEDKCFGNRMEKFVRKEEAEEELRTTHTFTPATATAEKGGKMRADEPIRFYMYGTGMSQLADYINQLRYERLMAKAMIADLLQYIYMLECKGGKVDEWTIDRYGSIRLAYEARARKIKEGMYD